ncbi:hypothetical protein [Tunturiibacter gelidiferens]|uniref:hypothetical protein n=1 Tax=Tunturiibacter gelidiferens TaxID=3069689 RepID=UPI003D9AB8EA
MEQAQGKNSNDLKNLVSKFESSLREKHRLKEIINANLGIKDDCKQLMIACNGLLTKTGAKKEVAVDEALYGVRNILFHRFGDTQKLAAELDEVSQALFVTVCELAICYQSPTVSL